MFNLVQLILALLALTSIPIPEDVQWYESLFWLGVSLIGLWLLLLWLMNGRSRINMLPDLLMLSVFSGWIATASPVPVFVESLSISADLALLLTLVPMLGFFAVLADARWKGIEAYRRPSRGAWAKTQFQMNLFALLPMVALTLTQIALFEAFPEFHVWYASFEFLGLFLPMLLMIGLVWVLPVFLRLALKTSPMPQEIMQDLTPIAERCKVRVDRVFVWHSRRSGLNTAFLIGLAAPFRYVFISDGLLENLTRDEVQAVFAHELGHAKHRHLWWLLVLMFTMMLFSVSLLKVLFPDVPLNAVTESAIGEDETLSVAGITVATLVLFGLLFGYISRRFERQADSFAAVHTNPRSIAGALDRLGHMAGGVHKKKGFRHFSIYRRVEELVVMSGIPRNAFAKLKQWRRERLMALSVLVGALLGCASLLAPFVVDDWKTGLATREAILGDMQINENGVLNEAAFAHYDRAIVHMERYLQDGTRPERSRRLVRQNMALLKVMTQGNRQAVDELLADNTFSSDERQWLSDQADARMRLYRGEVSLRSNSHLHDEASSAFDQARP